VVDFDVKKLRIAQHPLFAIAVSGIGGMAHEKVGSVVAF
jgi:hypothetical protein